MNLLSAWHKELASAGWTAILSTIIDVLLVTAAVYWLMMLSKRTRAWQIIWGLLIFLLLVFLTDRLELHTLNYLLRSFLPLGPVAIVILFYPELRRALENMGRVAEWSASLAGTAREQISSVIEVVVKSACAMSERQIGALIVIERENKLDEIASTGTRLSAEISEGLIGSIFNPGAPLHDGAVVIRGTRLIAAGCTLPLSEAANVGTMIHTRHKAALGVAEETDAAVVVVSEETGTISLALEGKLYRGLDEAGLTQWLKRILGVAADREARSELARRVNGTLRMTRFRKK